MARWGLGFLFPLTVWNGIMSNSQSFYSNTRNLLVWKSSTQPMNPRTSALDNVFSNIVSTRALSTDRVSVTDFTVPPKRVSNRASGESKIRMSRGGKNYSNNTIVPTSFKKGGNVENDVSSLNVNRNFTVLPNSSLYQNDTSIDERNIIDGNNTSSRRNSGKVAGRGTDDFVYIAVRCGAFFGGIFFILLVGIGIYRARTRCQPQKYKDEWTNQGLHL